MRRIILALSMLIGVWLGVAISAPEASAATDCDIAVIDNTSDEVLGDTNRIETAIRQLEDQGIDVRVRAFETAPSGSLEAYQKEHVQNCPTWQGPDGHTKGNLMTFIFSMDRQSAIFYGSNLEAELGDDVDRIRADYMNAEFRNGNFPEGIIGAITESADVIDEYNHPSADTEADADETSSSSGSSAVWRWLVFGMLGLLTLGLIAYGIRELLELRRRRKQEWASANEAAYSAVHSANTELAKLGQGYGTRQRVETLYPQLDEEDQEGFNKLLDDFGAIEENARARASQLEADPTTYSLEKRRNTDAYRTIEAAYEEVRALAVDAVSTMDKITALCTDKEDAIKRAPETLQARLVLLDDLTAKHASLQEEGYRFTLQENFAKIGVLLETAGREIEAKRHGQALDELDGSEQILDTIQATLTEIPDQHRGLQKEHAALSADLVELKLVAENAMDVRDDIVLEFGGSHDDLLGDNEVANLVGQIESSLEKAKTAFSMEEQRWAEADQLLADCEQKLVTLRQGSEAIVARMNQLIELEQTLGSHINNLNDLIEEVANSCNSREGGRGEFTRRLRTAERELADLRDDLDADKPDLLRIDSELAKLKSKVKKVNEESEDEDRQVRRRRREEEEAERRRRNSYNSSSGIGTGFAAGSVFGSSFGSSGGGFDSGGGGSSSGGSDGGSSSGSW